MISAAVGGERRMAKGDNTARWAAGRRIGTRLVLNFPGFEGTPALGQLDRLKYGAEKTGRLWGFKFDRQSADAVEGRHHAVSTATAAGPNWHVRTRLIQFSWSDVIASYENEPFPMGFFRNFPKFLAFFVDGTVGRYFSASKRYWAFTIFPLLLIALFLIVATLANIFVITPLLPVAGNPVVAILIVLALTLLLCRWPGKAFYLLLTINDWGFARDMVNRVNPQIELRFREFADTLTDEIKASRADEIVIAGHSFGSVWAVAALALALEAKPDLLKGRNVVFLALGSSLLKIALAPNAKFMRDWAVAIMAQPSLLWHEIQTKDDIIAFYKADPFETLGIAGHPATLKIDRVKYKEAMERKRYRSMLASPYRTHRQYILYQDKRVPFDFILRLFGPLPARELALDPQAAAAIDPQGMLV